MFTTRILKYKNFPNVKLIIPSQNKDNRGSIYTIFEKKNLNAILPKNISFNHIKITKRKKNCLVGIHSDKKTWKLFGCINGKIYHNVSCLNKKNKNYLKNKSFILSGNFPKFILIPPGFGNSFYCYTDAVIIYCLAYKGEYFDVENQSTVLWNDKLLKIRWPCKNPYLSIRDKNAKPLKNNKSNIRYK